MRPSIVIRVLAYGMVVLTTGHFSGWAGALVVALIAIPVVVYTTEDGRHGALSRSPGPDHDRNSALRSWDQRETAPLLSTALNNPFWSNDLS